MDGGDDRKTLIADSAHGAGGSYALQIQVKVPLQTPYSPKKGGSGEYEGSSGDGKVPAQQQQMIHLCHLLNYPIPYE